MIVEPLVQGAGGILVQPPGYLRRVRELCDEHDVLLICDEVATGFGRTGTMFACEQEQVAPDFLCLGKGLTNGYMPLAATLTTERVYEGFLGEHEEFRTFFHGHTFTGNPLACAAAIASLDVFERERTLERLQPKIARLHELLADVAAMDEVAEVRGRGFMVGIDLGEHDPALRLGHRVTLEARRARRDRPAARRHGRADAAAGDHASATSAGSSRSPPRRSARRSPAPTRPARRIASRCAVRRVWRARAAPPHDRHRSSRRSDHRLLDRDRPGDRAPPRRLRLGASMRACAGRRTRIRSPPRGRSG